MLPARRSGRLPPPAYQQRRRVSAAVLRAGQALRRREPLYGLRGRGQDARQCAPDERRRPDRLAPVLLEHDTLGQAGDCVEPAPNDITCHSSGDGGYVIVANDHAGCVNTADLTFVHPDGTAVQVFLASCYKDAAGTLTPGTQTLSAADAESIFTNAGFDFTMPADVVDRGAQNIGTLATFH